MKHNLKLTPFTKNKLSGYRSKSSMQNYKPPAKKRRKSRYPWFGDKFIYRAREQKHKARKKKN